MLGPSCTTHATPSAIMIANAAIHPTTAIPTSRTGSGSPAAEPTPAAGTRPADHRGAAGRSGRRVRMTATSTTRPIPAGQEMTTRYFTRPQASELTTRGGNYATRHSSGPESRLGHPYRSTGGLSGFNECRSPHRPPFEADPRPGVAGQCDRDAPGDGDHPGLADRAAHEQRPHRVDDIRERLVLGELPQP